MFKKDLQDRLEKIFGFRKTTYDAPSDAFEQDTLFIEIQDVRTRVTEGQAKARVNGQLVVFSQSNKFPYGYMNKRIEKAENELTKPLFFFNVDDNIESSPARLQNIVERRTSFVFLYSEQYDPRLGELTTLEMEYNYG